MKRKKNARRLPYLSESKQEAERLAVKTDIGRLSEHLKLMGLPAVPPHATLVDAGAGIGLGGATMYDVLENDNPPRRVVLLDFSLERLAQARHLKSPAVRKGVLKGVACDVQKIPLADASADFVFSRFLFEYLADQRRVFKELHRILKPGGTLAIGDIDCASMAFYPISVPMQTGINRIVETLRRCDFDVLAGRKLCSYFFGAGMKQIQIHVTGHNVAPGVLPESERVNWSMKMDLFIQLQETQNADFGMDMRKFKSQFMRFITRPGQFCYTPLIFVSGKK